MCTNIVRDLLKWAQNKQVKNLYVSKTQWKVKFDMPDSDLKITCQLLRVDLNKVCVEFTRRVGDQLGFFAVYQDIEKYMFIHNDETN